MAGVLPPSDGRRSVQRRNDSQGTGTGVFSQNASTKSVMRQTDEPEVLSTRRSTQRLNETQGTGTGLFSQDPQINSVTRGPQQASNYAEQSRRYAEDSGQWAVGPTDFATDGLQGYTDANNSKAYSQVSQTSAIAAQAAVGPTVAARDAARVAQVAAELAQAHAESFAGEARGWAIGPGTSTGTPTATNNARYWAQQALVNANPAGTVQFDRNQDLTDAQKVQAQDNIGINELTFEQLADVARAGTTRVISPQNSYLQNSANITEVDYTPRVDGPDSLDISYAIPTSAEFTTWFGSQELPRQTPFEIDLLNSDGTVASALKVDVRAVFGSTAILNVLSGNVGTIDDVDQNGMGFVEDRIGSFYSYTTTTLTDGDVPVRRDGHWQFEPLAVSPTSISVMDDTEVSSATILATTSAPYDYVMSFQTASLAESRQVADILFNSLVGSASPPNNNTTAIVANTRRLALSRTDRFTITSGDTLLLSSISSSSVTIRVQLQASANTPVFNTLPESLIIEGAASAGLSGDIILESLNSHEIDIEVASDRITFEIGDDIPRNNRLLSERYHFHNGSVLDWSELVNGQLQRYRVGVDSVQTDVFVSSTSSIGAGEFTIVLSAANQTSPPTSAVVTNLFAVNDPLPQQIIDVGTRLFGSGVTDGAGVHLFAHIESIPTVNISRVVSVVGTTITSELVCIVSDTGAANSNPWSYTTS